MQDRHIGLPEIQNKLLNLQSTVRNRGISFQMIQQSILNIKKKTLKLSSFFINKVYNNDFFPLILLSLQILNQNDK